MGQYADTLAELNTRIDKEQLFIDKVEGTKETTITIIQDGDDFDTSGVQVEGMINGEGDGMSDEIPGVIEGGQNLRVSDGEFIVPADVVSMLGNGSSNAGAKELYDMMDRIRVAKTGKTRQLPETDAEDFLPA